MVRGIESESVFVWRQIWFVVKLPFLIVLLLIGKKSSGELAHPLKELFEFVTGAKATLILILVNIAVFIFEISYLGTEGVMKYAFQPSDLWQLNIGPIFASMFLHASLLHLTGNMIFLFVFGRIVEMKMGTLKMLLIYFGSGIISIFISGIMGEGGIGASGAIAGLISTSILLAPFYFTYFAAGIPLPIIVVGWLAILADITGILVPTDDNIGHFAHVGGYIAISILVFLLGRQEKRKMFIGLAINVVFGIALAFVYLRFPELLSLMSP
jgi:rhomboid family protein